MDVDPPPNDPDKYGVNTFRKFKVGDRVRIREFVYHGTPSNRPNIAGREAFIYPPAKAEPDRFAGQAPHSLVRVADPTGLVGSDLKLNWCQEDYMDLIDDNEDEVAEAVASITGKRPFAVPTRPAVDMAPVHIAQSMHLLDRVAEAIYANHEPSEWLPTADGSPNSASYEYARRALKALGGD